MDQILLKKIELKLDFSDKESHKVLMILELNQPFAIYSFIFFISEDCILLVI